MDEAEELAKETSKGIATSKFGGNERWKGLYQISAISLDGICPDRDS